MFGLRFVYFALAALLCATANVAAIPTSKFHPGIPHKIDHDHPHVFYETGNPHNSAQAVHHAREAYITAAGHHIQHGKMLLDMGEKHDELGQHHQKKNNGDRAKGHFSRARDLKRLGNEHLEVVQMLHSTLHSTANGVLVHNTEERKKAEDSGYHAHLAHQSMESAMESFSRARKLGEERNHADAQGHLDQGHREFEGSLVHSFQSFQKYRNL